MTAAGRSRWTELIKVIVSIKDPFTLLAFFAVVLLLAFRTKTVPESLFRLLGQKIGRDRFYQLLNRTLLYSFAVFLVLCGIAVLGQWLTYKTTARAASLEELKTELAHRDATDAAVKRAIAEYEKGLQLSQNDKLSEAIASLEAVAESCSDGHRARDTRTPLPGSGKPGWGDPARQGGRVRGT